MYFSHTYQLLILALFPLLCQSQSGNPFIQNYQHRDYLSDEYYAGQQNWDVEQDQNGILYIANTEGIMEFDGITWHMIDGTESRLLLHLEKGADGLIYAAGINGFGFIDHNEEGKAFYTNLTDSVPAEMKLPMDDILIRDDEVVFLSTTTNMMVARSGDQWISSAITKAFIRSNYLFFEGAALNLVDRIFDIQGDRCIMATHYPGTDYGLLVMESGTFCEVREDDLLRKPTSGWNAPGTVSLYGGIPLNSDQIALSTISRGMIITDFHGQFIKRIDKKSGLINDEINNFFIDREKGLWLSLNSGISRIEYPAPITYFDYKNGLIGTVNAVKEFEGYLYAGTSTGLYRSKSRSSASFSEFTHLIDLEVWDIQPHNTDLLLATNAGVLVYDPVKEKQRTIAGTTSCHVFEVHPSEQFEFSIFIGSKCGLGIIEVREDGYAFVGHVDALDHEIRTIAEEPGGRVWAAYEQTFLVQFDEQPALEASVRELDESNAFTVDLAQYCEVYKVGNHIFFGTQEGIYYFDFAEDKMKPYYDLGRRFGDGSTDAFNLTLGHHEDIWMVCNYKIKHFTNEDGRYVLDSIPFVGLPKAEVWTIYPGSGNLVWIGTSDGLVLYNASIQKDYQYTYQTLIREVRIDEDSLLFAGSLKSNILHPEDNNPVSLASRFSSVTFNYSATSYEKENELYFRYKLDGFSPEWSGWSPESRKEFTNLGSGEYTFLVQAINVYRNIGETAAFRFSIEPKWYQRIWARILFIALFLLSLYLLVYSRSQSLIKRQKILQEKIEERTQQLRETRDQLVTQEKLASLGQLTAGIAHEIKNPLNFINNFSDLTMEIVDEIDQAKQENDEDKLQKAVEDLKQYVGKIKEHGVRADKIVNSMLGHSRQQSGEMVKSDVNNLVEESIEIATHGYKSQQNFISVDFDLDLDRSLEKVRLNPQNISRVILNILNNAFYAMERKRQVSDEAYAPKITIKTFNGRLNNEVDQSYVIISIRDNGTGIPKDIIKQVFNPFFTTKPAGSGTGLGLSISYDIIVKEHNGVFEINSNEGEYTEFILRIPGR